MYTRREALVMRGRFKGETVIVEGTDYDLWGKEWGEMGGNPAAMIYAMRSIEDSYIPDEGVVYGAKRPNGESTLFHECELEFIEKKESKKFSLYDFIKSKK